MSPIRTLPGVLTSLFLSRVQLISSKLFKNPLKSFTVEHPHLSTYFSLFLNQLLNDYKAAHYYSEGPSVCMRLLSVLPYKAPMGPELILSLSSRVTANPSLSERSLQTLKRMLGLWESKQSGRRGPGRGALDTGQEMTQSALRSVFRKRPNIISKWEDNAEAKQEWTAPSTAVQGRSWRPTALQWRAQHTDVSLAHASLGSLWEAPPLPWQQLTH